MFSRPFTPAELDIPFLWSPWLFGSHGWNLQKKKKKKLIPKKKSDI